MDLSPSSAAGVLTRTYLEAVVFHCHRASGRHYASCSKGKGFDHQESTLSPSSGGDILWLRQARCLSCFNAPSVLRPFVAWSNGLPMSSHGNTSRLMPATNLYSITDCCCCVQVSGGSLIATRTIGGDGDVRPRVGLAGAEGRTPATI